MATGTTNHDEIRRWAEAKGGKPAAVKRTHEDGDVGIIRIMFPDNPQSSHDALVEISWDEFFEQFEQSGLAMLYDGGGVFSKIVGRDTLEKREHGEHASRHHSQHGSGHAPASPARQESQRPAARQRDGAAASDGGEKAGKGDDADLAAREYRDAEGNVHHHTKAYMEQHGGKR